jgi:hypothetical protein
MIYLGNGTHALTHVSTVKHMPHTMCHIVDLSAFVYVSVTYGSCSCLCIRLCLCVWFRQCLCIPFVALFMFLFSFACCSLRFSLRYVVCGWVVCLGFVFVCLRLGLCIRRSLCFCLGQLSVVRICIVSPSLFAACVRSCVVCV